MLKVANLECARGDRRLFTGLGFDLAGGTLLHVRGPNGAGKTTLLRTLCGLVEPEQGDITWGGESIRQLGGDYRRELIYLGHLNGIKYELTPLENLRVLGRLADAPVDEAALEQALKRMGLARCIDLPVKVLSQGQKRRVALARLLLQPAKLWVLDEPFTALDVTAVELLQDLIREHVARGGMVILTTHQDVALLAERVQTLHLKG